MSRFAPTRRAQIVFGESAMSLFYWAILMRAVGTSEKNVESFLLEEVFELQDGSRVHSLGQDMHVFHCIEGCIG